MDCETWSTFKESSTQTAFKWIADLNEKVSRHFEAAESAKLRLMQLDNECKELKRERQSLASSFDVFEENNRRESQLLFLHLKAETSKAICAFRTIKTITS